jgi:hypothetical protein
VHTCCCIRSQGWKKCRFGEKERKNNRALSW